MYISLLQNMMNGFSWPAKIMAGPFKSYGSDMLGMYFFIFAICEPLNLG